MSTPSGSCSWPVQMQCCSAADIATFPPDVWENAQAQAVNLLWAATARRFGDCRRIVRPCRMPCGGGMGGGVFGGGWPIWGGGAPFFPAMIYGQWINFGICGCGDDCSCAMRCKVELPPPCDSVEAVWVDGALLPQTNATTGKANWIVEERHFLIRTDGDCWPYCQKLDSDLTQPGTFGVSYRWGEPVPIGGQVAAGRLACEIAKDCMGKPCALPGRVTNVTRDGVSMTLDPMLFLKNGLTGIFAVDQWIMSVNPHQAQRPSVVKFPEARKPTAQTFPNPITPTPLPTLTAPIPRLVGE